MKAQQLIDTPRPMRPHVVLLGAGASRAAFPDGDSTGKRIPIMNDLVDILDLQPLLDKADLWSATGANFETIYSRLYTEQRHSDTLQKIEQRIDEYFSSLSLPVQATIYDRLLVALRPTDAVFTFNWDPFLFDAYVRNRDAVPLPEIFFLHGNVRIGACRHHDTPGPRGERCPDCGQPFVNVPLLYPIQQKDYSRNPYIRRNWEAARVLFSEAFTLTISATAPLLQTEKLSSCSDVHGCLEARE